jgi:hypothetical protein
VAQYGDACNFHDRLTPDELTHKFEVLQHHCRRVGRPYEAIEKTVFGTKYCTPDGSTSIAQAVAHCRVLAGLGVDTVLIAGEKVDLYGPAVLERWEAELIPAIHALAVAGR